MIKSFKDRTFKSIEELQKVVVDPCNGFFYKQFGSKPYWISNVQTAKYLKIKCN